jgi:hypothetical protein
MLLIEDLTPEHYRNQLEQTMLSYRFPWYYSKSTVSSKESGKELTVKDDYTKDNAQFVHIFRNSEESISEYYSLVTPLLVLLESTFERSFSDRILRFKANLIPKNSEFPENFYNTPHTDWGAVDSTVKTETLIYYVNDSDGDTFLFNEKPPAENISIKYRVSPKRGSGILFDSHYLHAGQPPRVANERCIINIVFRK